MEIEEDRLRSVIEKVADKLLIKQWWYVKENNVSTVKNYFGVLVPVKLIGNDKDGETQKSLFIKFAPNDVAHELKRDIQQLFEVEVYMYLQLLPIYKRLSNIDLQQLIPDYYYADLEPSKEVVVMKDMRSEGFKRYGAQLLLDSDHIGLSLESLAKFHALSIILKEKDSGFDNTIIKTYADKRLDLYYNCLKRTISSHIDIFKGTIYENYLMRIVSEFDTCVTSISSSVKCLIYGHGDFQKENILFKYENSKPIQACLLDFQRLRKMSPAQDILTFLLTNTKNTDVLQHQRYINTYLDKFHTILTENNVENVYGEDDLKGDMKVVAPFCVASTVMAFSLWLGLGDLLGNAVKSENVLNISDNSDKFKDAVVNMLNHLDNLKYISL